MEKHTAAADQPAAHVYGLNHNYIAESDDLALLSKISSKKEVTFPPKKHILPHINLSPRGTRECTLDDLITI